jgi:ribosome assembly protein 3
MVQSSTAKETDKAVSAEFTSYYLQRATKEFAEDLDKIRNADDFKSDAVPLLVHALEQGTALFSPEDQRRIIGQRQQSVTANDSKT